MNEAAIDTLTIAHRLRKAGFDGTQAEAVTFAIRDGLTGDIASKEDVANLRGEIKGDIARLEGKIEAQGERLEGMIEAQGQRFDGKFTALYWMFNVLIAGVATLVIKAFFG